jgi:hypothetical protein
VLCEKRCDVEVHRGAHCTPIDCRVKYGGRRRLLEVHSLPACKACCLLRTWIAGGRVAGPTGRSAS